MAFRGDRRALAVVTVRRLVSGVLDGEGIGAATIAVSFLSADRMRGLHRKTFGKPRSTDVIAFGYKHGEEVVGDVYICPAVARVSARRHRISPREELGRLVIHGMLHVLGHDHPTGRDRTRSDMWRRQESYVDSWLAREPPARP